VREFLKSISQKFAPGNDTNCKLDYLQFTQNIMTPKPRSSLSIACGTWKALFLREAVTRLSTGRAALWILIDPIVHILFLVWMFSVIRMHAVGGIHTSIWIMIGISSYDIFKSTMNMARNAISSNKALFTYRQVRPVDTVLARAGMEGFLMVLVVIIVFSGAGLFGVSVIPDDPLAVLEAMFGMWLIGLGFALMLSVIQDLVPELGKIINIFLMPLYICSGVILPISSVPQPYRDWLIFNPLLHGVEAARLGFSPYYHAIPELSIGYIYGFALVCLFLGLSLQVRFTNRLISL
jgi:capsular polysaccharide transport system permease protein